ncbi:MAG: cell wall hydrolase, partial [Novosphingobium sp.]
TATFISQPVVQPVAVATPEAAIEADPANADSLAELVEDTTIPASLSDELECLAGAVYFEAKSETLAGQLAVGRVIVARASSGRFPSSYCGVVYQPSQFSFVRGRSMPAINRDSHAWQTAVRIARIADEGLWKSPVEGAMFFHAARVSPRWDKTRMARVDSHIFYR